MSNSLPALAAEKTTVERPVFLVGAERSGTALLRLMLDYHPNIIFSPGFDDSINETHSQEMFPRLNEFLRQFQAAEGRPAVGAVVHHNFDQLLQWWPQAAFIHIVRDGRDVSRSCISMGWAGDGWHGAGRWLTAERTWDALKPQLPEQRRCEVRFEDLILNTTDTLDRICQFIGVNADEPTAIRYQPEMMDYAKGTGYRLPDAKLVNQWHSKGSKREIQLIEARIAPMLVERGYVLSGLPHLRVSKAGQIGLSLQNKCGRLIRRTQRYGWPLVSADLIARQLRLTGLSDRIRKKINRIDSKTMQQSWKISDT